MKESVQALMGGIIDYAGLFPPAKLEMAPAVRSYAEYLASEHAWMLGRFVVPVARLDEFERFAAPLFAAGGGWLLSVLAGEDLESDLRRIEAFNEKYAGEESEDATPPMIDAIEIKGATGEAIDAALTLLPGDLFPFFEIPINADPRGLVAALSGAEAGAKVRTGGVTPDAFPSTNDLARFLEACASADVPFKATAGLHHALRGEYKLTYEPASEKGVMHGFMNVFLAAALARSQRVVTEDVTAALEESSRDAFQFDKAFVGWRGRRMSANQIGAAREQFALSFGSCSFTEPVAELQAMGLIEPMQ